MIEREGFAGLNSDDESRAMAPGDYRYALNIRNDKGVVENIKGDTLVEFDIPYSNDTGIKKERVVGVLEDLENNRAFYLVSVDSSLVNVLFPVDGGDPVINEIITPYNFIFEYKAIENQIYMVSNSTDLGFDRDNYIDNINLVEDKLYWVDKKGEPKKINVSKGSQGLLNHVVNIYFDIESEDNWDSSSVDYEIIISDAFNNTTNTYIIPTVGPEEVSRSVIAQRIAKNLNEQVDGLNSIIAEGCGEHIKIEFLNPGLSTVLVTSTANDIKAVPQNFYNGYNYDVINQIKASPACEPTITLGRDASKEVNLIARKVFQFAVQYVFDDNEKTVLSPYSNLGYVASCSLDESSTYNYLRVDFSDSRLDDLNSQSVIKKVNILVREDVIGKWKLFKTVEQWDMGVSNHYVDFYNDGIYPVISDIEQNRLQHDVPKIARTQEFMKNRLFQGDITYGFDPVCVDASIKVDYDDPIEIPDTYTITGKIVITSATSSKYPSYQPIYDRGNGYEYGGFHNGFVSSNDTRQSIPLGGFVVYLAGTDFKTISVQQDAGLPVISTDRNVYQADTSGKRGDIRDEISNEAVYSTFSIPNVPDGDYIVRIASHETTQAEYDSLDRRYQRTSARLSGVVNSSGGNYDRYYEAKVTVSGGNLDVGEFEIIDLSSGLLAGGYLIEGYLYDNDTSITTINYDNMRNGGTSISNAVIGIDRNVDLLWASGQHFSTTLYYTNPDAGSYSALTDHNGYFYAFQSIPDLSLNLVDLKLGPTNSSYLDDETITYSAYLFDGSSYNGKRESAGTDQIVIINSNNNIKINKRTLIKGSVKNQNGLGVSGATVSLTKSGNVVQTDVNGNYEAYCYVDSLESLVTTSHPYSTVSVIPNPSTIGCLATVTPSSKTQQIDFNVYNMLATVSGFNFLANTGADPYTSYFKRGGDYSYGLVYRDEGSRVSRVNTTEDLNKHITFYTEDNGLGGQNNYGKPTLSWKIFHDPPEWATHYQWVRTINEQIGSYVQFPADNVEFLSSDNQVVGYTQANKVRISVSSILDYKEKYPNTSILITIDTSCRIRFIANENGDFLNQYIDLEVLEYSGGEIVVYNNSGYEIKKGWTFEIYKPRATSDNRLYYEFGECYSIENGYHKGHSKDQLEWEFNDNSWNGGSLGFVGSKQHNLSIGDEIYVYQNIGYTNNSYEGKCVVIDIPTPKSIIVDKAFGVSTSSEGGIIKRPASGTFKSGDVYYRTRSMNVDGSPTVYRVDDGNISDFWPSRKQYLGRLNTVDIDAREIRNTGMVVHSGSLLEDTKLNSLNVFDGPDYENLSEEYGVLYKLQKTGNVLVGICEFRTVSMYIQEQLISTATGTDSLVVSERVIGTVRPAKDIYGTKHPESVAEYAGKLYFFDVNNATFVRYASNGLEPITKGAFKFDEWTKAKAENILDSGEKVKILGAYDAKNDEYLVCFDSYGEVDAETLAFSEERNRWVTWYSDTPEAISKLGQKMLTFFIGKLWVSETNELNNNFKGKQYTSKIQIVSNENPKNIKTFRAISIESNKPWSCPEITIPANDRYPSGMSSRLKKGKFKNKEGIHYSEFLKDINSPGFSDENKSLINGRDLRGAVIDILMESDDTEDVVLFSVNVKSVMSEQSNR